MAKKTIKRERVVTTALSKSLHNRIVTFHQTVGVEFGRPSFRAFVEALIVAGLEAKGAP